MKSLGAAVVAFTSTLGCVPIGLDLPDGNGYAQVLALRSLDREGEPEWRYLAAPWRRRPMATVLDGGTNERGLPVTVYRSSPSVDAAPGPDPGRIATLLALGDDDAEVVYALFDDPLVPRTVGWSTSPLVLTNPRGIYWLDRKAGAWVEVRRWCELPVEPTQPRVAESFPCPEP